MKTEKEIIERLVKVWKFFKDYTFADEPFDGVSTVIDAKFYYLIDHLIWSLEDGEEE